MDSLGEILKPADGGIVSLVGAGGKTSLMFRLAHELSAAGDSVLTTTTTKIWIPSKDQSAQVIVSSAREIILEKARQILSDALHFTAAAQELSSLKKLKGFKAKFIDDLWVSGLFRWILVEADGAAGRSLKAPAKHEPVIPILSKRVVGIIGMDAVGKPLNKTWVFRPEIFSDLTGLKAGQPITPGVIATMLMHPKGIMKGCPDGVDQMVFLNKSECCHHGVTTGREIVKTLKNSKAGRIKKVVIGSCL